MAGTRSQHGRRVRAGVIIAILCLLFGAATTYVSAWVLMNLPAGREALETYNRVIGMKKSGVGAGAFGVSCFASNGQYDPDEGLVFAKSPTVTVTPAPRWSLADWMTVSAGKGDSGELLERAGGWPMRAVVERMFRKSTGVPVAVRGQDWTMRRANHVNPWMRRTLAFMPVWPGFAVNTGVFAAVWMVVIGGPVVRRWRRAAAGECPKCKYDLRGLTAGVCPECGEKIEVASHAA